MGQLNSIMDNLLRANLRFIALFTLGAIYPEIDQFDVLFKRSIGDRGTRHC